MKKPTIDEWFAIQREKARRMGYIGGHRLSEEVIKELLLTKIEEFRAQM